MNLYLRHLNSQPDSYNRYLAQHRRKLMLARLGAMLFILTTGIALGMLAAVGNLFFVAVVACWGAWGIRFLLTRHK